MTDLTIDSEELQQKYLAIKHRFYEQKLPKEEDLVVGIIDQIEDDNTTVTLPEYNGLTGMILITEISQRKIKSVHKILKVGKEEVLVVLRTDPTGQNIDLSKKKVPRNDVAKILDRYNNAKLADHIMKLVSVRYDRDIDELYDKIIYPLNKSFPSAYHAFRQYHADPNIFNFLNLDPELNTQLIETIVSKIQRKKIALICTIEVKCFGDSGINAVKEALKEGEKLSTPDVPIEITLIATPLYAIKTETFKKDIGFKLLTQAAEAIKAKIIILSGKFLIKQPPQVARASDEHSSGDLESKNKSDDENVEDDDIDGFNIDDQDDSDE